MASNPKSVRLHLGDISANLRVDRGVFSREAVDPGTQLLLSESADPSGAVTILDLGCGYGPIACGLGLRLQNHRGYNLEPSPDRRDYDERAKIWAIDVNERALELCRTNATDLGLDEITVCAPGDVPPAVRFDLIVSNPPIRIGKVQLHRLLVKWLERLAPHGRAELVVHKHLGADSLTRWLIDNGFATTRLLSRGGYRILLVEPKAR